MIDGVPLVTERITGRAATGFLITRATGKGAGDKVEMPHFSLMTGISSRLDVCNEASHIELCALGTLSDESRCG